MNIKVYLSLKMIFIKLSETARPKRTQRIGGKNSFLFVSLYKIKRKKSRLPRQRHKGFWSLKDSLFCQASCIFIPRVKSYLIIIEILLYKFKEKLLLTKDTMICPQIEVQLKLRNELRGT